MTAYFIRLTNIGASRASFINFECEHESVATLTAALNSGQIVAGRNLFTEWADDDRTALRVVRRQPYALTRERVLSIEEPTVSYVEEAAT